MAETETPKPETEATETVSAEGENTEAENIEAENIEASAEADATAISKDLREGTYVENPLERTQK